MTKSLLMTGWRGTDHAKYAAHTLPLMDAYALKHGMQFACINLAGAAPPSWMKLPNIDAALADVDAVVWVDCDVVIVDSSASILDSVPGDAIQAVVEHKTECGQVPNCGVWVLRQGMRPWLARAWDELLPTHRDSAWWEQAAIMELMGYALGQRDGNPYGELRTPTELYDKTFFLPATWNDHPADAWRSPAPAFVHVTQYADRLGTIRRLCGIAR